MKFLKGISQVLASLLAGCGTAGYFCWQFSCLERSQFASIDENNGEITCFASELLQHYSYSVLKELILYHLPLLVKIRTVLFGTFSSDYFVQKTTKVLSSSWFHDLGGPQKAADLLQWLDVKELRLSFVRALSSAHVEAENDNWMKSCDRRILVGLARLPVVDQDVLDSCGLLQKEQILETFRGSSEKELRHILLNLPMTGLDRCTKWFTQSAIFTGDTVKQRRWSLYWSFGGDNLSFARSLSSMPAEQVELLYLKALTRHSMVPSHRAIMLENGIVSVILQECKRRFNSPKISKEIGRMLGNLALGETAGTQIVDQGCLPVLRSWLFSEDLALFSHAVRTLANLDRDFSSGDQYEDGVYLLHPEGRHNTPLEADVIFVHGLRGGPFLTWRQEGPLAPTANRSSKTDCWPKAWLARDVPNIRVLMVEYDTTLTNWTSQCPTEPQKCSLAYRSDEIMRKLKQAGVGKKPVIWVTHSMGGLLVKQLLLDAKDNEEFCSMFQNTRGAVFYSTPHRGSLLASYSSQARLFLLPSVEVKELQQGSPFLTDLHQRFLTLLQDHSVNCLSFGETLPVQMSWLFKAVLVPLASSDPGVGRFIPLNVNHIDVCKPSSRYDQRYRETLNFIRKVLIS